MRVLVTGGAGFIGSSVVRELLGRGVAVRVLDNLSTGYSANLDGLDVEFIEGDVTDASAVDRALAGVDGVFHLAAVVGNVRSIEDPFGDANVNVIGALTLLEGMRRANVSRIVYSSSAACYGEPPGLPVDEGMPSEPDSPYGVSKLAAEKYVLCYGRLWGWSATCLRYFNVYGVRQRFDAYGNVIPIFAERLRTASDITIFGDGSQTRDFVEVRDVARANADAFFAGVSGIYNVAGGTALTINDLADAMVRVSGRDVAVVHTAPRPGEVMHSQAAIRRASEAFGYTPAVTLEDGLTDYWHWYLADMQA